MKFRRKLEDFIKIAESEGYEIVSLDNYRNNKSKIKLRHNKEWNGKILVHEFEISIDNFYAGRRCPYCKSLPKYTNDQFNEKIKDSNCKLISDYNGYYSSGEFQCLKCGKIFKRSIFGFLNGYRCDCHKSKKSKEKPKKSNPNIEFLSRILENHPDYEIRSEINENLTNESIIELYHKPCKKFVSIKLKYLKNKKTEICKCKQTSKSDEIKSRMESEAPGFELISEYKDTKTKVKIKHLKCGCEFERIFRKFIKNPSCPHCQKSSGSLYIENRLNEMNIGFVSEYKIKTKNEYYQYLDFYNENEKIGIEYDGEQHFIPIYGENQFNRQKQLDEYKNKYCDENRIKLIRIPFYIKSHNEIDEILELIKEKNFEKLDAILEIKSFDYFKTKFQSEYQRLLKVNIKLKNKN